MFNGKYPNNSYADLSAKYGETITKLVLVVDISAPISGGTGPNVLVNGVPVPLSGEPAGTSHQSEYRYTYDNINASDVRICAASVDPDAMYRYQCAMDEIYVYYTGGTYRVPADNVIALINDIGTVEYTTNCWSKLIKAREAYDKLENNQNILVDNYDVLLAAEAKYAELKAAADLVRYKNQFEDTKTMVLSFINAMAKDNDSEKVQALIAKCKAEFSAMTYDESKTSGESQDVLTFILNDINKRITAEREAEANSSDRIITWLEDFETDPAERCTFVDGDGDGKNYVWAYKDEDFHVRTAHSGTGLISSDSHENLEFEALAPDNWAVSPALWISDGDRLSFWAAGQARYDYDEVYRVYIGESSDPSKMTPLTDDLVTAYGSECNA